MTIYPDGDAEQLEWEQSPESHMPKVISNGEKWDLRFLALAKHVSDWSKDPSTHIGVVIVRDRQVQATGYNGFPKGIADDERLHDRPVKYAHVVHGEMNAIIQAGRDARGATLYLYGLPGPPCANCAKHIITAGITRVVSRKGEYAERWTEEFRLSLDMFAEAGVEYRELDYE